MSSSKEIQNINTNCGNISYTLQKSCRRRTTAILIDLEGKVKVYAPRTVTQEQITKFVNKKAEWIFKHCQKRSLHYQTRLKSRSENKEEILFLGKKYPLLTECDCEKRGKVVFNGQSFSLTFNQEEKTVDRIIKTKTLLSTWYRSQAEEILGGRVFHYSRVMNVMPDKITIRTQKRLWGSCDSRKKAINLNWQIIMAPLEVIDYIVVHELAHLFHSNHSIRFWNKVSEIMPDYKIKKKWLKDNAIEMMV